MYRVHKSFQLRYHVIDIVSFELTVELFKYLRRNSNPHVIYQSFNSSFKDELL